MTEEEEKKFERLIQFWKTNTGNDIAGLNMFYSELNHDFAEFIEAMYEQQESSMYAMELKSKLTRIYHCNESIIKLSNGHIAKFRDHPLPIYDVSSVYNLSRQLIESFIITFYLYIDEISTTERELRVLVYRINGLKRHIKLTDRVDDDHAQRKAQKVELAECTERIKNNHSFNTRTEKEQRSLVVTGKSPMIVGREEILKDAGLGGIIQQWILFSNYAHSEYISDRQYNGFYGNELEQRDVLVTTVNVNCRLTARLICLLQEKFSFGEDVLKSLPSTHQERIQLWNQSTDLLESRREL